MSAKPWCRANCGEPLDPSMVDRPDGSGLHALCVEVIQPAVTAGPNEAGTLALLGDRLGAEAIATEPEPCTNPWCGGACGFTVPEHIKAHGPGILIKAKYPGPAMVAEPAAQPGQTTLIEQETGNDGTADGSLEHPAPALFVAPESAPAFISPTGDHPLKQEMINIIRWYDSGRPRSRQRVIGPSEAGADCLRRLAYQTTGTEPCNTNTDPWFAIVGTAVHAWLAEALREYANSPKYMGPRFHLETRLTMTSDQYGMAGSCDMYRNGVVSDHKIVGHDALKRYRDEGPSAQYRKQVHIYGLGWEQAGWPVDEVTILFYPRSGYLDGMHVWSEPYDRDLALSTLDRLASVRNMAALLGPASMPASPNKTGCVWCPFYRPGKPVDATGCPGK